MNDENVNDDTVLHYEQLIKTAEEVSKLTNDKYSLKLNFSGINIEQKYKKTGITPSVLHSAVIPCLREIGAEINKNPLIGDKIKNLYYEHVLGIPFPEKEWAFRNDYHTFWEEMFKVSDRFTNEVKPLLYDTATKGRASHGEVIKFVFRCLLGYSTRGDSESYNRSIEEAYKMMGDLFNTHIPTREINLPKEYMDVEKTAPKNPKLVIIFGMSGSGKTTLTDYLTHKERYFRLLPKVTDREDRILDEVKIGKNDVVLSKEEFDMSIDDGIDNFEKNPKYIGKSKIEDEFKLFYVKEKNGKRYGYFVKDILGVTLTKQHVVVETTNYELVKELKEDFSGMSKVAIIDYDLETITERLLKRTESINLENEKLMLDGKISQEQYLQKKEELEAQTANRIEQNKKKYASFLETKEIADIILNGTFEDNVKKVLYELSNEKLGYNKL